MRPPDAAVGQRLDHELQLFDQHVRSLPGIRDPETREAFIEQILESSRRVRYVSVIRTRPLSPLRSDPSSDLFDPLKAAIIYQQNGEIDEAYWMVFLFVHFGKNAHGGWRFAREIYAGLTNEIRWDWARTSAAPSEFRDWLHKHQADLRRAEAPGGFGNHRKYLSLNARSSAGTGAAVETYVNWIDPPRTHQELMDQTIATANGDPKKAFDDLYRSMEAVASFGRMARFDYLTMVGKLELSDVEPGSPYIKGSTTPLKGAQLLFGSSEPVAELDSWLVKLGEHLGLGMQVIEDSLCNWHKSPNKFVPYRE